MASVGSPRASRGRGTRRRVAAALTIAVLASSSFAGSALAAPQSVTIDRTLTSGLMDLGGQAYVVSDVISGNITVTATATLTQPIRETIGFDDGSLRQGANLAVHRSVAPHGAGNLHVVWHVTDTLPLIDATFDTTADSSCTISFTGPVTCDAESVGFALTPDGHLTPGVPYADLVLQASVKVTPNDATVVSTELGGAVVVGGPASQPEPGTQSIDIPCTIGKGDTLSLSDADYHLGTHINSTDGPGIKVGVWLPLPVFVLPAFKSPGVTLDLGPQHAESFDQDFTDATTKVTPLGPVAPNNVPPRADAGGPYTGKLEGVPVAFTSASTSVCGASSLALRWDFSDGGVAFGPSPFHTFTDDGTFSGLLTATDPTGLSNSVAFSVVVGNQNPVANAGPDTTADWGRPVAFNGQATDPGAGDQSTLQYTWNFDDGTPSATGGPSVIHAFAGPGTYHTTLTVTDKDGGSDSDMRDVVVTKRDTVTGYLGATAGTYDTGTSLRASLVDEYGASLNGKSIDFSVDGTPAGSASTNSFGIATQAYTPLVNAGPHLTSAAFGGDALYNLSAGAGSIDIARKATSVTYTGALNGGPNKPVGLSAILADATGTRLAGRTIVFVLGAQTKSAITDANGVATTTLTLNQKNAIYPLTATFTPAGSADPLHYLGSSDARSFNLQKK